VATTYHATLETTVTTHPPSAPRPRRHRQPPSSASDLGPPATAPSTLAPVVLPTEAPSPATIQTLTIHPSSPPRTTLQLSPLQSPAVLPVPTPPTPASPSTPPPPTLQPVVPFGSPPSPFVWPPPPFGSPGPFQSLPSPTLRPPRLFPFDLDDVRAYRYTLTQIPNRFNSVFPPDFPYGVPEVTILSPYKLMRPLLFARQITRFAAASRILRLHNDKLFFLGTLLKGITIQECP